MRRMSSASTSAVVNRAEGSFTSVQHMRQTQWDSGVTTDLRLESEQVRLCQVINDEYPSSCPWWVGRLYSARANDLQPSIVRLISPWMN